MTEFAKEIVNALVKDKQTFEHLKRSIAWRMKDAEYVDINEVAEIKEEVMVLQREVFLLLKKEKLPDVEEIKVLQREVFSLRNHVSRLQEDVKLVIKDGLLPELKKELSNMIRPIIIEQLPSALDLLFAEEEQ